MRWFTVVLLAACMVFVGVADTAFAAKETGTDAPSKLNAYALNTLAKIGMDAQIVKFVKAKNAAGESMAAILDLDAKWKAEEGVADYMQALMDNDCAKYVKGIRDKDAAIFEIFVMDNQGALVGETDKTGDYWQGDEAKWQQSFNNGAGGIFFIEGIEFDTGMGSDICQVSVPVMDGGKAIGAITFGVIINKVK